MDFNSLWFHNWGTGCQDFLWHTFLLAFSICEVFRRNFFAFLGYQCCGRRFFWKSSLFYPFGFFTVSIFHFLDLEHQLLSSPPAVVNDSFLPAYSVASFLFRFYPTQLQYTFNPHYRLFICPFQFIWLVLYCSAHFKLCSSLRFFLPLLSTRQLTW